MADIFISYAKTDRPLALKLAAMLEAEGWTTWWDTSLTIGDDFRNEIMTELGRARAVIVIWTDGSIKSDWVRSEAGRAQADRKLIPVKLAHLVYEDLPPPFDVLHTENVGEEDKIKAAVVAQLAKPAVEPTAWVLLTKGFNYELLTWFGIVGGALTLFTNLGSVLKLADWARVLVQHWREWTHEFWVWTFGLFGIHLPPEWTPVLSFLLFGLLLTIGQAVKFSRLIKSQSIENSDGLIWILYHNKWTPFKKSWAICMYIMMFIGSGWMFSMVANMILLSIFPSSSWAAGISYVGGLSLAMAFLAQIFVRTVYAAVILLLLVAFWIIITLNQLIAVSPSWNSLANFTAIATISILPVILLAVAPAKAVSRRLIFLALGLLLLIALNELSKLVHYWGVTL
jgi:TIR domain